MYIDKQSPRSIQCPMNTQICRDEHFVFNTNHVSHFQRSQNSIFPKLLIVSLFYGYSFFLFILLSYSMSLLQFTLPPFFSILRSTISPGSNASGHLCFSSEKIKPPMGINQTKKRCSKTRHKASCQG